MLVSEQHKTGGQKRRITWQPNPGRVNPVAVGQPEDALIEPILGDVAIDERVAGNVREPEVEEEPQGEGRENCQEEESCRAAKELPERSWLTCLPQIPARCAHVANIAGGRLSAMSRRA